MQSKSSPKGLSIWTIALFEGFLQDLDHLIARHSLFELLGQEFGKLAVTFHALVNHICNLDSHLHLAILELGSVQGGEHCLGNCLEVNVTNQGLQGLGNILLWDASLSHDILDIQDGLKSFWIQARGQGCLLDQCCLFDITTVDAILLEDVIEDIDQISRIGSRLLESHGQVLDRLLRGTDATLNSLLQEYDLGCDFWSDFGAMECIDKVTDGQDIHLSDIGLQGFFDLIIMGRQISRGKDEELSDVLSGGSRVIQRLLELNQFGDRIGWNSNGSHDLLSKDSSGHCLRTGTIRFEHVLDCITHRLLVSIVRPQALHGDSIGLQDLVKL